MRKSTVIIFNQLDIKNNKINKDNFEKKIITKQIMWRKIIAINSVLKKKQNYKIKFSTISVWKKINLIKDNFKKKIN